MTMTQIRYFTILGERCSGTHFLQHAILSNFAGLSYLKGEKHFFGNKEFRDEQGCDPETLSLHEKQMLEIDGVSPDELLVLSIVRDPVEWVDSFYKRKHHVPVPNREPVQRFLTCEFYSVYEEGPKKGLEIMEDRNWRTKQRYRNLFELRAEKNAYLREEIPKRVKHHWFLRYEDLRDHYQTTLERIEREFGLPRKPASAESFVRIEKYKGTYHALYEKKPVELTPEIQEFVWQMVDVEQERVMGYLPVS
jgi:hypothetical protein